MRLLNALLYSSWPIPSRAFGTRLEYIPIRRSWYKTNFLRMQGNLKRPRPYRFSAMSSDTSTFIDTTLLQHRSPYEQQIEKIITTCNKCHGEGKIRGNPSKKAKAKKKQMQSTDIIMTAMDSTSNNDDTNSPNAYNHTSFKKPCKVCSGTGLLQTSFTDKIPTDKSFISNSNNSNLSVAIVGGGIGGFALAAALQHRNIECVVYERDLSFEGRNQGYGLTMQQGARALRALGFMSDHDKSDISSDNSNTNTEDNQNSTNSTKTKFGIHSTRHAVHKPDGTIIGEWGLKVWGGRYEKAGRGHATRQNAHISRQNLRKVLMDMLRPGSVRWGYKFMGYVENDLDGDDGLKLKFLRRVKETDGAEKTMEEVVTSSVLVGCDGIRSVVRSRKLGEQIAPLRYLDCIVILGIGPSPNDSPLTDGETVFQTADGVTRLYAMPFAEPGEQIAGLETLNDKGLSMWQLSFPMKESDAKRLSKLGAAALKTEALCRCGNWHDPIPQLLESTPQNLVTGYPCYDRALIDKDSLRNGFDKSQSFNAYVTMLGDAAHPMSPFKGQGANQALLDAVLLAQKLYSAVRKNNRTEGKIQDLIPEALAEFEDEMLQRCAVKVKKSAEAAKFLHSDVAIKEGNVTRGAAAVEMDESNEAAANSRL